MQAGKPKHTTANALSHWQALDEGRVLVSPAGKEAVAQMGWDSLDRVCSPSGGESVRTTPTRRTSSHQAGDDVYYRKVHFAGWSGAGLRDRLRLLIGRTGSPARVEFEFGRALADQGIPVPQVLLLADDGRPGGRSAMVTRGISSAAALDRVERARALSALPAAANMVATLHRLGYAHRDLYLNHFLLDGGDKLWLTDLQRVIRPGWQFSRWRTKDLAAILHSTPPWVHRYNKLRFFAIYAKKTGLTKPSNKRRLLAQIQAKQNRMAAHKPKWG